MTSLSSMMIWTLTPRQNRTFLSDHDHSWTGWMIDCERCWNRSPEDAMQDIDKRSMIWRMFMSSTLEASVFIGKNYSDNLHSMKNTGKNLILNMFDILQQLILEQPDETLATKDHKENGTKSLNWWWSNSEKADTQFFRATSPLSRGTLKSKGGGKLSIHFCAHGYTIETFFAQLFLLISSASTEQSQIFCEEYSACQARTGRPVLAGQSDPMFAPANLLTMRPRSSIDILAQEN